MSETPPGAASPRVALVTGAADGPGREFAVALARLGHRVAGLDLADLSGTADRIGGGFHPVRADVTDPVEVEAAVEETAARFGGLHIVVNNAGICPPLEFERTTLEDWRRIMRVNLDGPFLVTRAALPHLKAAGWGRIVNIASAMEFPGPPGLVAYTTSKAGLVGFTRALASAAAGYGITVNAISPGLAHTSAGTAARTDTDANPAARGGTGTAARTAGADGGFGRAVRGMRVVPGAEEPRHLVSTLLYVCDERSGLLTGQTINVDGGFAVH